VNDWPAWKTLIEMKLRTDAEAIGDAQDQFAYVFTRLEKLAWKNASTYVRSHQGTGTPGSLLAYLEQMYGDPNARARAARRLYQMRQPDDMAFRKFLPRIEREFADAGALAWPDEAKRQILLGALNSTMTQSLMSRGVPPTFLGLIDRLHEISNDRDTLIINNPRTNTNTGRQRRTSPIQTDEMDWTPTVKSSRARTYDPQAKRARWVKKDEMDRRREEGLCFRCGRENCQVSTCPFLPAIRPDAKVRKAKTAAESGRKSQSEDETGSDSDSEKE
jgi:hypothetical protein